MKDNNIITSSRKRTPWDNNETLDSIESFLVETYHNHYKAKHPKLAETNEAILINSFDIHYCKRCGSNNYIKFGKTRNGINRYYCKDCNRTFTIITNTIFDNHKIAITEWVEFLLELISYGSFNSISRNNRNSINTTYYWVDKLFLLLATYSKNLILKDKVYIDETFYTVIKKDIELKEDGNKPRGLSKNKYCIGIGCDNEYTYARVEGFGKTSTKRTKETFIDHIKEDSTLIHDKEKAHNCLVDILKLKSITYDSTDLKKLEDKDNPLNSINQKCRYLKRFLNTHSGFDRDNLQDLINLFLFINNPPINKLEKIKLILQLAFDTRMVLKFRDKR